MQLIEADIDRTVWQQTADDAKREKAVVTQIQYVHGRQIVHCRRQISNEVVIGKIKDCDLP